MKASAAEFKATQKADRLTAAQAKDMPALLRVLEESLLEKKGTKISVFNTGVVAPLPRYSLSIKGRKIGFADVIAGDLSTHARLNISWLRNGAFAADHFCIAGREGQKAIPFCYLVFLLSWEKIFFWKYHPDNSQFCVENKGPEYYCLIPSKDWNKL